MIFVIIGGRTWIVNSIYIIATLSTKGLFNRSKIIITDSGGVQEEAPSLGKPVLVMREITERPEAVDEGTVLLVGTNQKLIVKQTLELLTNDKKYNAMSELHNPYGDGNACERIVKFIKSK